MNDPQVRNRESRLIILLRNVRSSARGAGTARDECIAEFVLRVVRDTAWARRAKTTLDGDDVEPFVRQLWP